MKYFIDKSRNLKILHVACQSLSQNSWTKSIAPDLSCGILNTDLMELEDDRVCRAAPGKSRVSA